MMRGLAEMNAQYLRFQRNILAAISLLLSVALILCCSFLFLKHERVIITPPKIEKEFWVEANNFSPTYLEQFGIFLSHLLLNKSASSACSQKAILLRHTDPTYAGSLSQKLFEEEELLKKQNASYVFYPVEVQVDPNKMAVHLTGDRALIVLGKQITSERECYILSFSYSGSRLLLNGINRKKCD